LSKYRVCDTANGVETSETIIEASCFTEALKQVLEAANITVEAVDDNYEIKEIEDAKIQSSYISWR
jgi:organic hydroperoxide reductase OsmC/OhrA